METLLREPSSLFHFDRTRQAAPQVFEHMREQILALSLPPGTVLSRIDLAAQYGISQTPVRDALIRLAEEGLVDIFPQHATRVSRIDVALARQAHFLRRSVELEIVRTLAAAPDARLIEKLRTTVDRAARMLELNALSEFSDNDQAFHRALYDAANVPDLHALVRRQSGHLDRLRRLHLPTAGKAHEVLRDHAAIVDAIATGNAVRAEAVLREHLSGTLAHLDEIRAEHGEYIK
ncbi:GntR family transcriptional regulator [Cupriavidus plantarum]|uniref:GntR family transcriptional regulator n=1 Tax=Cupriavidus plantarum TaxID=942865 RepID=UPI00339D3608